MSWLSSAKKSIERATGGSAIRKEFVGGDLDPLERNPFDPLNVTEVIHKQGFGQDDFNFYDPINMTKKSNVPPDVVRLVGAIVGAYTGNPYIALGANAIAGSAEGGTRGANMGIASTVGGQWAGNALGKALGSVGATADNAAGRVLGSQAGQSVPQMAGQNALDDIVVTGTRGLGDKLLGGAVKTAQGIVQSTGAKAAAEASVKKPMSTQTSSGSGTGLGKQFGQWAGERLGQSAVDQALASQVPQGSGATMSAPAAIASTTPFGGGGAGGGASPAGLSIKGSSAPNIYPWTDLAA